MELAIDPLLEADGLDFLDVAGAGAVGQAVERLENLLIGGKLFLKQAGIGGVLLFGVCGDAGPASQTQRTCRTAVVLGYASLPS